MGLVKTYFTCYYDKSIEKGRWVDVGYSLIIRTIIFFSSVLYDEFLLYLFADRFLRLALYLQAVLFGLLKIAGKVYLKISPHLLSWHQMFIFISKSDIESCTIGMRITQRNGLSVFLSSGYDTQF